jgi:hypothetical protein
LAEGEIIMSDGGIGDGITFWATINIRGTLKPGQIKPITNAIRKLLNDMNVDGEIVHCARMSAPEEPNLSISMKHSKQFKKK